ncbi:MAG TPA: antibiotic biosynthesis monooxygenase [Flavisolibacter sp.]|jgi:quinol monooxygenase YgiN
MSTSEASFVVNSTYTIHPDDVQLFADAVRPHIKKTQAIPGCLFYTFSFDLVDKNLCHLAEGWTDREVINTHLKSALFQEAYTKVLDNVRVLAYKGTMYSVSSVEPIKPVRS